jgi:hypothetical protein
MSLSDEETLKETVQQHNDHNQALNLIKLLVILHTAVKVSAILQHLGHCSFC